MKKDCKHKNSNMLDNSKQDEVSLVKETYSVIHIFHGMTLQVNVSVRERTKTFTLAFLLKYQRQSFILKHHKQ